MSDDPKARMRFAADQFGAALGDAMKQAWRQAFARQLADQFGPGPWVLHEDGHVGTTVPPGYSAAPLINRILWNQRDDDRGMGGDIDEIVVHGCTVHVEQMDDRTWWIGIDRPDGAHWAGNFHADSRGRMRFWEQENIDLDWDRDDSHDDRPEPS